MIKSMETTSNTGPKTEAQSSRRVISFGDGLFRYERPGGTSSWVCRVADNHQRFVAPSAARHGSGQKST